MLLHLSVKADMTLVVYPLLESDSFWIKRMDLLIQHFRDGCGRGLPLAERIVGIDDHNHRVGFFRSRDVGFELTFLRRPFNYS